MERFPFPGFIRSQSFQYIILICLWSTATLQKASPLYDTPFVARDSEHSHLTLLFPLATPRLVLYLSDGPQIRTVPSSEADASTCGYTGFQVTQLTVLVCPEKTAMGSSFLTWYTYTLESSLPEAMKFCGRSTPSPPPNVLYMEKWPCVIPTYLRTRERDSMSQRWRPWLSTLRMA